jgi:glutathione peroxidase
VADDDPSGIATYSQAGAEFGIDMLWTMPLTYPLMPAIQPMCARIGRLTGKGLAANLNAVIPAFLRRIVVLLLLVAYTLNIAADAAAMGEVVQLASRWHDYLMTAALALITLGMRVSRSTTAMSSPALADPVAAVLCGGVVHGSRALGPDGAAYPLAAVQAGHQCCNGHRRRVAATISPFLPARRLRGNRGRDPDGGGARRFSDRPDQGAVSERGDQRGDGGGDHPTGDQREGHGRLHRQPQPDGHGLHRRGGCARDRVTRTRKALDRVAMCRFYAANARQARSGKTNAMTTDIQNIPLRTIAGQDASLADHAGKVVLIVNVASKCGLTPQYEGLEKLYQQYRDQGLVIAGFPANDFGSQEPGSNAEIADFCTTNFGVDFPMYEKITVTGAAKHPLYAALTSAAPKAKGDPDAFRERLKGYGMTPNPEPEVLWNFEKFLVSRDGKVAARFAPTTDASSPELVSAIEDALKT